MIRRFGVDVTSGSIPGHLLKFAWPMLTGNLLQVVYGVANSFWVGKFLGKNALAAVSVSFPIIFVLLALVIGFTMATTVLVAQYWGAKNLPMVERAVQNSTVLLGILGTVLSLFGILGSRLMLGWIRTPAQIMDLAAVYLQIYLSGLLLVIGFNLVASVLRGLGDSITPLYFLAVSTVLNVLLDPLLIFGFWFIPRLGAPGTALASVLSQGVAFFMAVYYLKKRDHIATIRWRRLRPDRELTLKTLNIGFFSAVQQVLISLGSLFIMGIVNRFGAEAAAAFGAAMRFDSLAFMPAMSIGFSVSALVGQNIGARKQERVVKIIKWGALLEAVTVGSIALCAVIFPSTIISFFIRDPEVIRIGASYLRIVGPGYFFIGLMFVASGAVNGAGDTKATMLLSLIGMWAFRIPVAAWLAGKIGLTGVWWAIALGFFVTFILYWGYYLSGYWKRIHLVETNDLHPVSEMGWEEPPII